MLILTYRSIWPTSIELVHPREASQGPPARKMSKFAAFYILVFLVCSQGQVQASIYPGRANYAKEAQP